MGLKVPAPRNKGGSLLGDSGLGPGVLSDLIWATNSKLLGTKILEVCKNFRVELENT